MPVLGTHGGARRGRRGGLAVDVTPRDDLERAVLDHLAASGGEHEVIEIDPDLADTADFCAHYGYALEDSANCILVASKQDPPQVAACLVLATTQLDVNSRVRKLMGVRRLSFAPEDLVRDLTGMQIGGVTPFALPPTIPLLIDEHVVRRKRVIVGGGSRRLKILVDPAVLAALPDARVEDIARLPM